jgi:hypothetical protein
MSLAVDPTTAPGDGSTLVKIDAKLLDDSDEIIVTSPGTYVAFSTDVGTLTDKYGVSMTVAQTSTSTGVSTLYIKAPHVPVGTVAQTATIVAIGGGVAQEITVEFTPSILAQPIYAKTSGVETTDPAGNSKTTFVGGETVLAAATIENISPIERDFLVVIQAVSPQGVPLPSSYIAVTLDKNQEFTFSASIVLPTGQAGTWTLEVNVFNTFPAAGGEIQATPVSYTFTVA